MIISLKHPFKIFYAKLTTTTLVVARVLLFGFFLIGVLYCFVVASVFWVVARWLLPGQVKITHP